MAESITHEQWLARIREQQQASWRSGTRTPIEVYLERNPEVCANRELLIDLVYSEIVLARERGDAVDPEDYYRRFPQLADDLRKEFEFDGYLDDILPEPRSGSTLSFAGKLPLRKLPIGPLPTIEGYQVLRWIESGSFGDVFRARDLALHRLVALKVLKRGGRIEESNFKREAQLVAGLNKPGCFVQIFEFGETEGQQYFSMELMEGGSLKDLVQRRPQSPVEIARLMGQVARALQAAHDLDVVHRDLKPSNILLTRDGVPKIADFGLAKKLNDDATLTPDGGAALGTVAYMAPEQARGQSSAVGPAADIYALGGLLYFMLSGRAPLAFDRNEPSVFALQRIVHEIPDPPRRDTQPGSKAPKRTSQEIDLETICLKCLEKDPAHRFASAGEVADRLKRVEQNEPIPERPPGLARRMMTSLRRNARRTLTVAALVALAVLSIAALAIAPWRQPPTEAEIRSRERARITRELRTSGRYVFDRKDLLPGPFAWRLGGERTFKKGPHVTFDSLEFSLLELTDDPGVDRWRLSAQVRHKNGTGDAAVGFYFSAHRLSAAAEPIVESFYLLGFCDRGTTAWTAPLKKEDPTRYGTAFLAIRLLREGIPFGFPGHAFGSPLPIKAIMTDQPPSPLRELRLEVTPEVVRGFCEEQGTLQMVGLPQSTQALLREITVPSPGDPYKIRPVFSPHASVGLFVLRSEADFEKITLERLEP